MADTELRLSPTAVALHTRDRDNDYRWRFAVGQFSIADRLKEIHRELIADRSARAATSLIFLDRGDVLGLVVANLKSQRRDHSQTLIDDTLLAEFAPDQRQILLLAVASLVDPSTAKDFRSRFLAYAEEFFHSSAGQPSAGSICIPALPGGADDGLSGIRQFVVHSNDANLRRVASLLQSAATTPEILKRPFLLVSTGFVGPESLEPFTNDGEQFIALSRSSKVPESGELSIKKKLPAGFSKLFLGIGICLACVCVFLIYRIASSSNSNFSSARDSEIASMNSNGKTNGSVQNLPSDHGRNDELNQASRAAAAVGLVGSGDRWTTLAAIPMMISDTPVSVRGSQGQRSTKTHGAWRP